MHHKLSDLLSSIPMHPPTSTKFTYIILFLSSIIAIMYVGLLCSTNSGNYIKLFFLNQEIKPHHSFISGLSIGATLHSLSKYHLGLSEKINNSKGVFNLFHLISIQFCIFVKTSKERYLWQIDFIMLSISSHVFQD